MCNSRYFFYFCVILILLEIVPYRNILLHFCTIMQKRFYYIYNAKNNANLLKHFYRRTYQHNLNLVALIFKCLRIFFNILFQIHLTHSNHEFYRDMSPFTVENIQSCIIFLSVLFIFRLIIKKGHRYYRFNFSFLFFIFFRFK